MAFASKFQAEFAARLLDHLQAVLERDVNAALASIDGSLPLFAENDGIGFRTPTPIAVNFPALYLEPSQSALVQSADDSRVEEQHEFAINVALTGPDANTLKRQIVNYVLAIDQVLRSMSVTDLTGGLSSAISKPTWEVTEHRYGVLRSNDTLYRRDAQLILVVQDFER